MQHREGVDQLAVTYRDRNGRWARGFLTLPHEHDLGAPLTPSALPSDAQPGVVTGGFTDWHVHLHLIDAGQLIGSPIVRVHDLGGVPAELQRIADTDTDTDTHAPPHVTPHTQVLHAGAFFTPPGGYPSDREWAPAGSFREVASEADAPVAVDEMRRSGASAIKVASNVEAGPVFDDAVFGAVVAASRAAGLPVVAHAEGPGEALRVARLGAQILAHAPFSELLNDNELTELAATTTWISTLDIHGWGEGGREHEIAVANIAGFVRHGGRLRYGTDMGNGPTVTGLNERELASLKAAGLSTEQMLDVLTPLDPLSPNTQLLWVPRDETGVLRLAGAMRLPVGSRVRAGHPTA